MVCVSGRAWTLRESRKTRSQKMLVNRAESTASSVALLFCCSRRTLCWAHFVITYITVLLLRLQGRRKSEYRNLCNLRLFLARCHFQIAIAFQ